MIRFSVDQAKMKVLDLTNSRVARTFNYKGGPITDATKAIGEAARTQGYNAIKFKSLRGKGNNFAILDDFNDILTPQMLSPVS